VSFLTGGAASCRRCVALRAGGAASCCGEEGEGGVCGLDLDLTPRDCGRKRSAYTRVRIIGRSAVARFYFIYIVEVGKWAMMGLKMDTGQASTNRDGPHKQSASENDLYF